MTDDRWSCIDHGASQTLSTTHWRWGTKIEEQDFRSVHGEMAQVWVIHPRHWTKVSFTVTYFNYTVLYERDRVYWYISTHLCNRDTLLFHSFTLIINDMNRTYKKNKSFKSKKPYRRPKHGPELATSTSTSTGTTDLMLSIPDCDSELDGTTSAQVAAGVSVSVRLRPSHI